MYPYQPSCLKTPPLVSCKKKNDTRSRPFHFRKSRRFWRTYALVTHWLTRASREGILYATRFLRLVSPSNSIVCGVWATASVFAPRLSSPSGVRSKSSAKSSIKSCMRNVFMGRVLFLLLLLALIFSIALAPQRCWYHLRNLIEVCQTYGSAKAG